MSAIEHTPHIQKSIGFVVLCSQEKKTQKLDFCLERLNTLEKEKSGFSSIFVYLVPTNKKSLYIRHQNYRKEMEEKYPNLVILYTTESAVNAIEARQYNLGLNFCLDGPSEYIVFLHDDDVILDRNLLGYYNWLFSTAHNPNLVGAVSLSENASKQDPPKIVKMWYGDDVGLRGTCFKREAIIDTGPFDETFLIKLFEPDYSSRMIHHQGWLTRLGKEPNTFIKLSKEPVHKDFIKMKILTKQNFVWFARKWHNKGIWPNKKVKAAHRSTCAVKVKNFPYNASGTAYLKKFVKTEKMIEKVNARFKELYGDKAINKAIEVSAAFMKSPLGGFCSHSYTDTKMMVKNDNSLQTYVDVQLKYHDNMLWKAKKVY